MAATAKSVHDLFARAVALVVVTSAVDRAGRQADLARELSRLIPPGL